MVNPQLAGAPRRMSHPDLGQGSQATGSEETTAVTQPKQDRPPVPEMGLQSANGTQQMMVNQGSNTHMMKQGPGPSPIPQHPGASPQQQLPNQPQQGATMPGLHFPNVPTTQSSRPKTPNRASPRPYHHPLTPTNRPPSTEPSEINLSPERLNASIAGLFPPKINIPLPPRQPNLNRGFDQQGLNPTTLKAIGQAPPSLVLPGNNSNGSVGGNNTNSSQQSFSSGTVAGTAGVKQDKQSGGQGKRASPSNSRRSSPASGRKSATPSPGRQKGAKMAVTCSPHQQQLVNPQGQTMMLGSGAMPSQASGGLEAQQTLSPFNTIQSNSAEAGKDNMGEQRPMFQSQAMRELTSPRMASPRISTPQQPKVDTDSQAGTTERQSTHAAQPKDLEASPALREAPTSLNQLLDNTNVSIQPLQSSTVREMGKMSALDGEKPQSNAQSSGQATVSTTSDSKRAVSVLTSSHNLQQVAIPNSLPSINVTSLNPNPMSTPGVNPNVNVNPQATTGLNTNTTVNVSPNPGTSCQNSPTSAVCTSSVQTQASSVLKPSPSPKPVTSVHSVIQIPASSSTISPNQITVFVTSNPITSTPAPQPPTSMVSTMMAVPNKNLRPQDVRQPGPAVRPQFITTTPLFINPIIQVPSASVTSSTTVVSQPVTMVQVSTTNIQLSPATSSTQSLGVNVTSSHAARSAVGQFQITTTVPSSALIVTPPAPQQISTLPPKPDNLRDANTVQKSSPPLQQSSPYPIPSASSPFQAPLSSPPPCSSPGAVNTVRKSPVSPSSTQVKNKSLQAVTAEVQSLGDRSTHGVVVTTQALNLPTSPPIQKETAVSNPGTMPGQIAAHSQTITQASVSRPSQTVTCQAPMATIGMASVTSAATLLSTVTPVQSSSSVVPIVAVPVSEGTSTISSPSANHTGVPPNQSDPLMTEPPTHASSASVETSQNITATSQCVAQTQETLAIERTGEEVPAGPDQGWAKKRKAPINLVTRVAVEKPKGPSRRSSRAEKEAEEEPVADSSIRKRSARPATTTAVKETGASPTQAKRRKSK